MKKQLFKSLSYYKDELENCPNIGIDDWVIWISRGREDYESEEVEVACIFPDNENEDLDFKYSGIFSTHKDYIVLDKPYISNWQGAIEVIFRENLKTVFGLELEEYGDKLLIKDDENYLLYTSEGEEKASFTRKELHFAGKMDNLLRFVSPNEAKSPFNAIYNMETFSWLIHPTEGCSDILFKSHCFKAIYKDGREKYFDIHGRELEKSKDWKPDK